MNHTTCRRFFGTRHTAVLTMLAAMLFPLCAFAQMLDPVKFKVETKKVSDTEIDVTFTGKIEGGWHVYSTNVPNDGPTPATFHMDNATNIERLGALQAGSGAIRKLDKVFEAELEFFENSCRFTQRLKITGKDYSAKGYLEYGACSNVSCMPPTQVDFSVKGNDGPDKAPKKDEKAEVAAQSAIADTVSPLVPADTTSAAQTAVSASDSAALWASQTELLNAQNGMSSDSHRSLLVIFLLGVLGGFVALLTPCVWPIIPMTVSFFLHRQSERRKAVRDAILYGVAIIVIYVGLGLVVTSIWGANQLNALSTNAIFNIFFFLLLVVFAASFLGGFDITLPSSWGNKVNSKSRSTSGMASIFLMALTLAIVSFSCTGPVIGFLLVEVSSTGKILAPALGMLGFCHCPCAALCFLCAVPRRDEENAQERRLDEHGESYIGFRGTGICTEISFGCRFGLRVAHTGPRNVSCPLDSNLCRCGILSLWADKHSRRPWKGHLRYATVSRTCLIGFRHIHGARTLGRTA